MDTQLAEKVRRLIEGLGLDAPEVRVMPEGRHLTAQVVSGSFEGLDEATRQARVWKVFDALTDDERRRLEFIFTNAPSEMVAA